MQFPPPAEFILSVLRKEMNRREAERIRDAITDGYADPIRGRKGPCNEDLRQCSQDYLTN